jgi:hypothetical protein
VVTKRSGQAQTALISRRPATVERTRRRQHPERIRATTNQVRIGDPVIRTRIRRQSESNLLAAWNFQARWVVREPFLSPRPLGTKPQQINRLPNRKPKASASFQTSSDVKSGCQSVACVEPRRPDPGRERRKRAQREPESATRRVGRFAGRKTIPIRPPGRLLLGHGRQSLPSFVGLAAPIRDAGEGNRHKGSRNQRRGASGDSPGERQSQIALLEGCRQVMVAKTFLLRSLAAPIRDEGEGNRHKGSRNQRRGPSCESPRERQSQFDSPWAAFRSRRPIR